MGEEDPASKKFKELLDVHTDNALAALQKHREMTGGDGKRERRKSSSSSAAAVADSFTTTTRTITGTDHPSLFVDDDDDDNNNDDDTDDYDDSKDRDGITKLLRKFGCVDTALKIVMDNPKSHYDYHNRNHHHPNNNNNNNRSILRTQSLKQSSSSSSSLSSRSFVIRPPGSSQSCSSGSRWTTSCDAKQVEMGFNTGLKLPIRHASLEEQKLQRKSSS